jgi:hypothetical protein
MSSKSCFDAEEISTFVHILSGPVLRAQVSSDRALLGYWCCLCSNAGQPLQVLDLTIGEL